MSAKWGCETGLCAWLLKLFVPKSNQRPCMAQTNPMAGATRLNLPCSKQAENTPRYVARFMILELELAQK